MALGVVENLATFGGAGQHTPPCVWCMMRYRCSWATNCLAAAWRAPAPLPTLPAACLPALSYDGTPIRKVHGGRLQRQNAHGGAGRRDRGEREADANRGCKDGECRCVFFFLKCISRSGMQTRWTARTGENCGERARFLASPRQSFLFTFEKEQESAKYW